MHLPAINNGNLHSINTYSGSTNTIGSRWYRNELQDSPINESFDGEEFETPDRKPIAISKIILDPHMRMKKNFLKRLVGVKILPTNNKKTLIF